MCNDLLHGHTACVRIYYIICILYIIIITITITTTIVGDCSNGSNSGMLLSHDSVFSVTRRASRGRRRWINTLPSERRKGASLSSPPSSISHVTRRDYAYLQVETKLAFAYVLSLSFSRKCCKCSQEAVWRLRVFSPDETRLQNARSAITYKVTRRRRRSSPIGISSRGNSTSFCATGESLLAWTQFHSRSMPSPKICGSWNADLVAPRPAPQVRPCHLNAEHLPSFSSGIDLWTIY